MLPGAISIVFRFTFVAGNMLIVCAGASLGKLRVHVKRVPGGQDGHS